MEENKTLWKASAEATDKAISKGVFGGLDAVVIDNIVDDAFDCINPAEYNKEWLIKKVIRSYICIYAASLGYKSGMKGKGVYFSEDIMHEGVSLQLVQNEEQLAKSYVQKAESMKANHEVRFNKNCEISGQGAFDTSNTDLNLDSIYTEMTITDLINLILGASAS